MDPPHQLAALDGPGTGDDFAVRLVESGNHPLLASRIEILQLNITRRCNLTCRHCHLEAAPNREEMMSSEVLEACVRIARMDPISTIDITGGSPELHPRLPWLLHELADTGKRIMVRTNLVVLQEERFRTFPKLYSDLGVEVVGSLPDYLPDRTDRQRGAGTFERCIRALRDLNQIGYGCEGSGLVLDLTHNPAGLYLPGNQASLEGEYRRVLRDRYGVEFNRLFVLTNCPIGRFLEYLLGSDNLREYMRTLRQAFNPSAVPNMMCRTTLSVGWDGSLYDCDFNQALGLPVSGGVPAHIRGFDLARLAARRIVVRNHCFACCAGAGSSCQGALEK